MSVRPQPKAETQPQGGEPTPQGDGTAPKTTAGGERPAWLPEKFESAEAMAAAYAELERKQSGAPATKPAAGALPTMEKPAAKTAEEQVNNAGLDFDALAQEVATSGSLSEDSLKALEAKGLSRTTVNTYIEGQKALAKQTRDSLASVAGSEENLTKMIAWGSQNFSADEQEAFNSAVTSGNLALAKMAVSDLRTRFTTAVGAPGKRVEGSPSGGSGGAAPFANTAEMTAAMRDPRYSKDAKYRADVMKRVAASPRFFG